MDTSFIGIHETCGGLVFEHRIFDHTGWARYQWTCSKCGGEIPGEEIIFIRQGTQDIHSLTACRHSQ